MTTAVIYARYSSSNQREESIQGQIRDCLAYAERNGITVLREYTDSALTGKTDKRPSFQQMIKDSERHSFQVVLVWKLDRFARNRYDSAMYRNVLKKNGVRLVSVMENISDSPEGIILEGLMESLAEYYSANLSENVKRGLYDSALERKIISQPTFGYKRGADGRYEIDELTAPIVRRVFHEYANGKPYMAIVEDLNRDGIRTLRGNKFNRNSLRKLLRNEKYIGVYRYRDILDENGIPPIVSKELFDSVQHEVKRRTFTKKRITREESDPYLLTGKLFCGHCGSQMVGESARSKTGKTYHYYTCAGTRHQSRNGCKKRRVHRDWIEHEVIRIVNEYILTDEFIQTLTERIMEIQKQDMESEILKLLKSELTATEAKIANLMKAIEAGAGFSESIRTRLSELESLRDDQNRRISLESHRQPQFTAEQISDYLTRLRRADKTDSDSQRLIINALIKRIYLFDCDDPAEQKISIEINYGDESDQVTHEEVVRIMRPLLCLCVDRRTMNVRRSILIIDSIKKDRT